MICTTDYNYHLNLYEAPEHTCPDCGSDSFEVTRTRVSLSCECHDCGYFVEQGRDNLDL